MVLCFWFLMVIKDLIDHEFGSQELSRWDDLVSLVCWLVGSLLITKKKQLVCAHVDLNRISLTVASADREFEFSPSLPSGSCMPQCVCPLCSLFIPVPVCVPASEDCLCFPIHSSLASGLNFVSCHFFWMVILVDDLDLSVPVLMLQWFFRWTSACRHSSAVMDHQIPARWKCVCFKSIFKLLCVVCCMLAFAPAIIGMSGQIHTDFLRPLWVLADKQMRSYYESMGKEDNRVGWKRKCTVESSLRSTVSSLNSFVYKRTNFWK